VIFHQEILLKVSDRHPTLILIVDGQSLSGRSPQQNSDSLRNFRRRQLPKW
jgi:hypothetical protein